MWGFFDIKIFYIIIEIFIKHFFILPHIDHISGIAFLICFVYHNINTVLKYCNTRGFSNQEN